jgi:hypothetical protein
MVPGWRESTGAIGELQEARRLCMPVFLNVDDLPKAEAVTVIHRHEVRTMEAK